MDKNNAITTIFNVLSQTNNTAFDDEILDNLLSFLITLLEGCNINLQNTIYNYFITVPSGEYILEKFFKCIDEEIKLLRIKNELNIQKDNNVQEINHNNFKPSILEKILKLMKLFTEGHFLDLQNYMRHQTNSRINYDLVSQIIELLHAYHFNISQYNYNNILICLKTLTEFVQVLLTIN